MKKLGVEFTSLQVLQFAPLQTHDVTTLKEDYLK